MSRLGLAAGVGLVLALALAVMVVLLQGRAHHTRPVNAVEPPPSARLATLSPSSQPSEPVAVPTPDTTGRDFDRIVREVVAFRDWLYAHPDPDLVALIYHPECECHDAFREELQGLLSDGVRFDPQGTDTIVHRIEVLEDFPSLFRVRLTFQRPRNGYSTVTERWSSATRAAHLTRSIWRSC